MFAAVRSRLPPLAFVLVTAIGWAGAGVLLTAARQTEEVMFAAVADEATNRIGERIRQHIQVIEATAAIIEAQGDDMTAPRFAEFFNRLRLAERTPGMAGLGFAPLLEPDRVPALVRRLQANYGGPVNVWPEINADLVAPIVFFASSDPVPRGTIGFDGYSDPPRRAAMQAAALAHAPRATEPVKLALDSEPLPGFIIYAPIYADSFGVARHEGPEAPPTGYAFAGFRMGEIISAALHVFPLVPVALTVADADRPDTTLFAYGEPMEPGPGVPKAQTRQIEVAGQTWSLTLRPSNAFHPASGRSFALVFGLILTALAAAVAMALREQARTRIAAEALVASRERSLAEHDLLLQEMRHRIKNAIARILAIARQTAARAEDLDGFTRSFTQRLQAMAEAQDMLSRSKSARADLRDLLTRELNQVFGADFDPARLDGPVVDLDATRTQALGLVFHELATNALKYGGGETGPPAIEVVWTRDAEAGAPVLALCWRERGGRTDPPERVGFGTRLIDASLRQELGGRVERDWTPHGLSLRMVVPLGFD